MESERLPDSVFVLGTVILYDESRILITEKDLVWIELTNKFNFECQREQTEQTTKTIVVKPVLFNQNQEQAQDYVTNSIRPIMTQITQATGIPYTMRTVVFKLCPKITFTCVIIFKATSIDRVLDQPENVTEANTLDQARSVIRGVQSLNVVNVDLEDLSQVESFLSFMDQLILNKVLHNPDIGKSYPVKFGQKDVITKVVRNDLMSRNADAEKASSTKLTNSEIHSKLEVREKTYSPLSDEAKSFLKKAKGKSANDLYLDKDSGTMKSKSAKSVKSKRANGFRNPADQIKDESEGRANDSNAKSKKGKDKKNTKNRDDDDDDDSSEDDEDTDIKRGKSKAKAKAVQVQ